MARHADFGPVSVLRLGLDRAYAIAALARPGQALPAVLAVELEVRGERLAPQGVGEVEVRDRRHGEQQLQRSPVGPGQALAEPPRRFVGLLDDVPSGGQALERWTTATAVIDTYRERYGIDDGSSAFGPTPYGREQCEERDRALAYVRQLVRDIEAIEPRHQQGLGRDRPAGPDLGR